MEINVLSITILFRQSERREYIQKKCHRKRKNVWPANLKRFEEFGSFFSLFLALGEMYFALFETFKIQYRIHNGKKISKTLKKVCILNAIQYSFIVTQSYREFKLFIEDMSGQFFSPLFLLLSLSHIETEVNTKTL